MEPAAPWTSAFPDNPDVNNCKVILYRGFEKLEVGIADGATDTDAEFEYSREGFGFTENFTYFVAVCLTVTFILIVKKCREVGCCLFSCCPVAQDDPKEESEKKEPGFCGRAALKLEKNAKKVEKKFNKTLFKGTKLFQWLEAITHISDYATDAAFLGTIDPNAVGDLGEIIIQVVLFSLLTPVVVLAFKGLIQRCRGSAEEATLTWCSIFGLQTIYFQWGKEEDLTKEELEKVDMIKYKSNVVYLMFEDTIQFPTQVVLTALGGGNIGFFQLFSPVVTFYSLLSSRLDGFEHLPGGWRRAAHVALTWEFLLVFVGMLGFW